jgi:uncharacterized protein YndB with AHSA1/START domain
MTGVSTKGKVLEIERRFEAPRDVVFSLWTSPRQIVQWWGPRGHFLDHCEQDFRVGGRWRFAIAGADGSAPTWTWGIYREIVAPERLVFSYSMDWHRHETLVSIAFEDLGDATLMRFRQSEFLTDDDCADHSWGWLSALDKLGDHISRMYSVGILNMDIFRIERQDGVAEDIAEARRRAEQELRERPGDTVPPSVEARKSMVPPPQN